MQKLITPRSHFAEGQEGAFLLDRLRVKRGNELIGVSLAGSDALASYRGRKCFD